MLCKLCEKERRIDTQFKYHRKIKVCDICASSLGYNYDDFRADVEAKLKRDMRNLIEDAVVRELPGAIRRVVKTDGLEVDTVFVSQKGEPFCLIGRIR
jgi:hypothetical protein